MTGRVEQLTHARALLEGTRIAVRNNASETRGAGLAVVPDRALRDRFDLFYRGERIAAVETRRTGGHQYVWVIEGRVRPFSCLAAACFAAAANHLTQQPS